MQHVFTNIMKKLRNLLSPTGDFPLFFCLTFTSIMMTIFNRQILFEKLLFLRINKEAKNITWQKLGKNRFV